LHATFVSLRITVYLVILDVNLPGRIEILGKVYIQVRYKPNNIHLRYEMAKIAGIELILSGTATFAYEIKQLDPLTQTLSLSITSGSLFPYITRKMKQITGPLSMIFFGYIILFFHTLHKKYSELQRTLHDLLWFLISNHSLLS
jgi:hypothetical protein